MNKISIINSPIITADGKYELKTISVEEAKRLINESTEICSFVGHQAAVDAINTLTGADIEANRAMYIQSAGETALVFRLKGRLAEGQVLKTVAEIEAFGYEFQRLDRLA